MREFLGGWSECQLPLEASAMLHQGTPIFQGERCQHVNPLMGKSQGFHPPSRPRIPLDERVEGFTIAPDPAIGFEIVGAWREEPQMVPEIRDLGFFGVLVSCPRHVNSSGHDLAPQSDITGGGSTRTT